MSEEVVLHLAFYKVTPYGRQTRHIFAQCNCEKDAAELEDIFTEEDMEEVRFYERIRGYEIRKLEEHVIATLRDGFLFDQAGVEPIDDEWCIQGHAVCVDDHL